MYMFVISIFWKNKKAIRFYIYIYIFSYNEQR